MGGRIKKFGQQTREMRLPEIGRLSIGIKVPTNNGGERPSSLDYFRLRNADPKVEEAFKEVYGDKPDRLLVSFFQSDAEKVCNQRYEIRVGRRKFAWGDGVNFVFWDSASKKMVQAEARSDEETVQVMNRIQELAKQAAKAKGVGASDWSQRLTMRLWLPEVPFVGEFLFDTKGEASSIKNLVTSFDTVIAAAGTVQRVPFELTVKMHDSDSMQTTRYPVVDLKPMLDGTSLRAVKEMGEDLFSDLRDFSRGALHLLSNDDISESAKRLRLNEGSGSPIVQDMPTKIEPPEPRAELTQLAESEEAWEIGMQEEPASFNDAAMKNPEELSIAESIRYLKMATSTKDLRDRWSKILDKQGNPSLAKAFWVRLVDLAGTKEELDAIVKGNKPLHGFDWFVSAVTQRRSVTG